MLIDRLLGKNKNIEPEYDDTRWFNIAKRPILTPEENKQNNLHVNIKLLQSSLNGARHA